MYPPQDYLLFFLAIALFLGVLALLGTVIDWREDRKTRQRERWLHSLNRREDLRRQCDSYLARTQEILASVEGRKSA